MCTNHEYELLASVVNRSIRLNIGKGDRLRRFLDVEFAYNKFQLDLESFIESDADIFAGEFLGIQSSIDRTRKMWVENGFVPFFSLIKIEF